MGQRNENWIHLFQILNVGKHKDGFTLYEVTSMVYPKSCPDAITKLVVWKRFNDFKYLYNEIKKRIKNVLVNDKVPKLPSTSYFKRFTERVIEERKQFALELLEFIGKHPVLYTSDLFVKFFESSYVPQHQIKGNIDAIRDELHLPEPPDIVSIKSLSSEDDITVCSESDSLSTRSNLSLISSQQHFDSFSSDTILSPTSQKLGSNNSLLERDSFSIKCGTKSSLYNSDNSLPSIPELTSEVLIERKLNNLSNVNNSLICSENAKQTNKSSNVDVYYIIEAAEHISKAAEYESYKDYEQAFASYKLGISSLINGAKNDTDLDRKESVRHKVAKYLLKAEKIYNIHLNLDIDDQNWNTNISKKIADSLKVERPLTELSSIKVIDILSSVMLVTYNNKPDIYVIKVIRKQLFQTRYCDIPILPFNIPFMVKLYKYYCTEHSIYVLIEYAAGGLLWNYLQNKEKSVKVDKKCEKISDSKSTDNGINYNYLQLVNEYQHSKEEISGNDKRLKVIVENEINQLEITDENIPEDTKNLLKNAQELLSSVSDLLHKNRKKKLLFTEQFNTNVLSLKPSVYSNKQEGDSQECSSTDLECPECWSDECVKLWECLPESIVVKYASQLVVALESLHRLGIICYDLQPKNLLLDEDENLLLSYICHWENLDINRCKEYPDNMYTAPELSTIAPVTKAVDWWSFGVILYEMLTGLKFYLCHPGGFTSTSVLNIPKYVSANAQSLLQELLVYTPEYRLGYGINGAENIKLHVFFENVDWLEICQH